jgi:hypothetical protein
MGAMWTKVRPLIVVAALGWLLQGCDKFPYLFNGQFPALPAGFQLQATAVLFALQTPFPAGTLQVSGELQPETPGATLPSTIDFVIRQTEPGGAVVTTVTINLTVQPDGVIPNQVVVTPAITVEPGQELKFFIRPIGTALPFGRMKLKLLYEKA